MLLKILDLIVFISVPTAGILLFTLSDEISAQLIYFSFFYVPAIIYLFLIWDALTLSSSQKIISIKLQICWIASLVFMIAALVLMYYPPQLKIHNNSAWVLLIISGLFGQIASQIQKLDLSPLSKSR